MGLTANVVPGASVQSAWGNAIRDRTLQVFTDATERDAQWTAPPDGAHCLTMNNLATWVRSGGVWVPLSVEGRPLGARITTTADDSVDDTAGKLSGPTFTFTLAAARCVKCVSNARHQRSNAGQVSSWVNIDGADTTAGTTSYHAVGGGVGYVTSGATGYKDLAAGTHTARFRFRSTTGAATAFLLSASWFMVCDAGPNLGFAP